MVEQPQGRGAIPSTRYSVLSTGYLLNVLFLVLIAISLPWLLYQRLRHGKYREGFAAKFFGWVPERAGDNPCLWLHAVSVGEVNVLAPLLDRWRRLHPDWECVVSTTTQAGYALARKKYAEHTVIYCPLDFTWAVRRTVARLRPTMLVLAELELWPNLIAAARQQGAKITVINGRLSDKSYRGYRRFVWLAREALRSIDLIAAQNQAYAERFVALGARPDTVCVTGSVKFDGACIYRDAPKVQLLKSLAGITDRDTVFLAGSTQDPEESIALSVFSRLTGEYPHLKLILVPRHPERFDEVAAILERSGVAWERRSKLSNGRLARRVLLVDAVGELGHWWGAASIAFVGGSLTRRGGQNMIEPAGYGSAVSFGPNTWNFRDIVSQLLEREAAVAVNNEGELEAFVRKCLADKEFAETLGQRARELVIEQQGAADRTIALLDELLSATATAATRASMAKAAA